MARSKYIQVPLDVLTYPITIAKIVSPDISTTFQRGMMDEERKKKLPLALEVARLFALFVLVYFWSLIWFHLLGPMILP